MSDEKSVSNYITSASNPAPELLKQVPLTPRAEKPEAYDLYIGKEWHSTYATAEEALRDFAAQPRPDFAEDRISLREAGNGRELAARSRDTERHTAGSWGTWRSVSTEQIEIQEDLRRDLIAEGLQPERFLPELMPELAQVEVRTPERAVEVPAQQKAPQIEAEAAVASEEQAAPVQAQPAALETVQSTEAISVPVPVAVPEPEPEPEPVIAPVSERATPPTGPLDELTESIISDAAKIAEKLQGASYAGLEAFQREARREIEEQGALAREYARIGAAAVPYDALAVRVAAAESIKSFYEDRAGDHPTVSQLAPIGWRNGTADWRADLARMSVERTPIAEAEPSGWRADLARVPVERAPSVAAELTGWRADLAAIPSETAEVAAIDDEAQRQQEHQREQERARDVGMNRSIELGL